jgi:hypothetical protein
MSIAVRKMVIPERIDDSLVWGSHTKQPKTLCLLCPQEVEEACLIEAIVFVIRNPT